MGPIWRSVSDVPQRIPLGFGRCPSEILTGWSVPASYVFGVTHARNGATSQGP